VNEQDSSLMLRRRTKAYRSETISTATNTVDLTIPHRLRKRRERDLEAPTCIRRLCMLLRRSEWLVRAFTGSSGSSATAAAAAAAAATPGSGDHFG
jgi:hypothetical protein